MGGEGMGRVEGTITPAVSVVAVRLAEYERNEKL
jgi:hypothetical protein